MGFFSKKDKDTVHLKKTVDNPYLAGKQEWFEMYGDIIISRNNWKVFALIVAIIALISVGGNIYMGTQSKIIPYIVEVDKLGRAAAIAPIDENKKVSMKNVIPSVIAMVITDWRTVTADVELQKQMIKRLSYFTAGTAKGYVGDWYKNNNPYERGKENLISVELKSLPLPITADSYKAEWTETIRDHIGKIVNSVRFEATISIQTSNPTSEQMILHNPTGIFITSINATKLF